jgi:hypothetical protein
MESRVSVIDATILVNSETQNHSGESTNRRNSKSKAQKDKQATLDRPPPLAQAVDDRILANPS